MKGKAVVSKKTVVFCSLGFFYVLKENSILFQRKEGIKEKDGQKKAGENNRS